MRRTKKGKLSVEEIKESDFTWLRNRQRVVFLPEIEELCNKGKVSQKSCIVKLDPQFDESKKLLVVGGRLQFAQIPGETKHQIIIPHNDPVRDVDPSRSCQSKPRWSRDDLSRSSSTFLAHTRKARSKESLEKMSNL